MVRGPVSSPLYALRVQFTYNMSVRHVWYAENCAFAHGAAELRVVTLEERERHGIVPSAQAFKTALCWTWLTTGE